jgi:radical SAM protein with 4Fe4S-binding SPASM domain
MTPQELRVQLEKEYTLLDFVDLAEISKSSTWAHKWLKNLRRDTFQNNERIVIYTEHSVSDELLQHIHETVNFVDIGTYFVLFCSPQPINTKYEFQYYPANITGTSSLETGYRLPDTICAIPWNNLEIQNNGTITPCCFAAKNTNFGNINSNKLVDVFNGPDMQKLRDDLASGVQNPICIQCWNREKQNLVSIRQHNIKRLKDTFLSELYENPRITNLDIKFNNTCNFKCVICFPGSSSLRAEEDSKFRNIPLVKTSDWPESDNFTDQLNSLLPTINNLDMYGGEPFLTKKFSQVLETAVKQGYSKNIRLHYNSNGSVWPKHFIDYWPHFKEVVIHFSIDAIGKQFEYQRGGIWEDVESNILRIKNLNYPNLNISLMPSISILNIYYIDQVLDWAKPHGFQIFVSHVKRPAGFDLKNLTQAAKDMIIEKYKNYEWDEVRNILKSIQNNPPTDGSAFFKEINYFDRCRNTNFADHHKEIALAMNYVYNT